MNRQKSQKSGAKNRRKRVSLRKLEANRRNALRSTGPKTREGKRAVRWNALKHGLLAREVVIPAGEGRENHAEFRNLLAELRDDLQPSGVLEEILVEKIAVCYWRLRRVLRSEIGEIQKHLDRAAKLVYLPLAMRVELAKRLDAKNRPYELTSNSFGVQFLLELLGKFKAEVKETGVLFEDSIQKMTECFGDNEEELARRCSALHPAAAHDPDGLGRTPECAGTATESARNLLKILDEEKKRLEATLEATREEEHLRLESEHARLSLPEAVDKILRYETAIERHLYRALHQLEHFQRWCKANPSRDRKGAVFQHFPAACAGSHVKLAVPIWRGLVKFLAAIQLR